MNPVKSTWLAIVAALLSASLAVAQYRNEYGDIRQTVARISYIEGNVSFSRGDDPDNWQPADRNVPMTIGDRVYTGGHSRVELQVQSGEVVRLGAQSDVAALNLTDDTRQFSVKSGIASFQVPRLDDQEVFEVDTPNAAVTFESAGDYRVDVDQDGNTRVAVWHGRAMVAAGGGQVPLRSGDAMEIDGIDAPRYDIVALRGPDGWDRWVDSRKSRFARARSHQFVSDRVVGVDDLDDYGRWENIPEYGQVWTPAAVAADWIPYRAGHWVWQDPWGWTWISAEPWGWAPYHYGRWVTYSSRWYWVPVAPRASYVTYSPALVAFVGGGPGWSASMTVGGGGFVGWFPLGPRDPLVPWWGTRSRASVNVANVTYVNRTYVTVVNQNTFASGGIVTNNIVRDRSVLREVSTAAVARGPIPILPTRASLRVAVRTDLPAPSRPPEAVGARSVVARMAPPPAPPVFSQKAELILENRGAPVDPAAAARISVEERGSPRAISRISPVAASDGRVSLAPRNQSAAPARVEPVAQWRGRPMATAQQPVAPAPVTSSMPSEARPAPAGVAPREMPSGEARPQNPRSEPPSRAVPREAAPAPRAPESSQPTVRENPDWLNPQRAPQAARPAAAPARPTAAQPRQDAQPPGVLQRATPARPEKAAPGSAVPERGRDRQVSPPQAEGRPVERRQAAPAQDRPAASAPPDRTRPAVQSRPVEKKEQPKQEKQDKKKSDKEEKKDEHKD